MLKDSSRPPRGKIKRGHFGLNGNAALKKVGVMVSDDVKIAGESHFVKA